MAPFYSVASIFCFLLLHVRATTENATLPAEEVLPANFDKVAFQQVMTSSMQQPETKARLIEVMPLLRSLTRAQRHALAEMLQRVSQMPSHAVQKEAIANASLGRLLPQLDVVSLLQRGASEAQREAKEQAKLKAIEAIAAIPEARSLDISGEFNDTLIIDQLPEALELRRKMTPEEFMAFLAEHRKLHSSSKRHRVPPSGSKPSRVSVGLRPPPLPKGEECDLFANNLCLEVPNYPKEAIIASMKRSTSSVLGVLAREIELEPTSERRQDVEENLVGVDNENGATTLCQSITKFARPKRARNTNGQWKFLVNTGDEHSQTLRIELCTDAGEACNYVANGVVSQCVQVFTHHRLLSWDHEKGLYLDIFKVPTCCSCHITPAYGPAVFPSGTTPRSRERGTPPPLEAEPEYVEVMEEEEEEEAHPSAYQPKQIYTPRPSPIPVEWPTKRPPPMAEKPPARPPMPPMGKPIFPIPQNPMMRPPPVFEGATHPPLYGKDGRKRIRPRDKNRSDLDEAGATATHRRRRPPHQHAIHREESEENSRINYSYHPIIDFFRNEERQKQILGNHQGVTADRRTSGAGPVTYVQDDWRPIEPSYQVPQKSF